MTTSLLDQRMTFCSTAGQSIPSRLLTDLIRFAGVQTVRNLDQASLPTARSRMSPSAIWS